MTKSLPSFITEDTDAVVPGDNQIKSIAALVEHLLSLEAAVESAEANLKNLEDQFRKCSEVDLPEALAQAGVKKFTMDDGTKIEVKDRWKINVSKDRRPEVIKWLREVKQTGLVRAEVAVEFPKGDMEKATEFANKLVKMGVKPSVEETFNTQSLEALVNELIDANADLDETERTPIPEKTLGLFKLTVAKVKLPKR